MHEKSKNSLWKKKSFVEGFAEYMCLDNLLDVYDNKALKDVIERRDSISDYKHFSPEDKPYERGYKFFRKVLSIIGEDKVLEVAKSPPISEIEVRTPLLYRLRKYTTKGIKNTPKFLTRGMKTKILKKLFGYAPFDF